MLPYIPRIDCFRTETVAHLSVCCPKPRSTTSSPKVNWLPCCSGEKRRIEEKIRRTEEKSQEYKALEKQSRREMKAQEVIAEMKEVYRGMPSSSYGQ